MLIGATPEGRKELVGFTDGARESAQDWRDLLLDLKRRGLDVAPRLAIADGAIRFWKAAGEVWPKTREQRCWVHKTANVIAKLPKSQQPKAKRALQEIWMAEPRLPPSWRSTPSSRATRPNTRRRLTACVRIATRYWRSTTFEPSTGNTCGRRMRWTSDF